MRTPSAFLLVAILLACPAICQATAVGCCSGHEGTGCSDEPEPRAPEDSGSCLCGGTILKAEETRGKDLKSTFTALPPFAIAICPQFRLDARSRVRFSSDLDDWLEAVRPHVRFQVFRC